MTAHAALGVTAGVLSFVPCPIYVRSMVQGRTRPDRVTWWVLALGSGMIAASHYASGGRDTVWLPIGYAASFTVIALFSLKYGDGPWRLHRLDRLCLGGAVASAAVWWSFDAPLPALVMTMVTEFIGLIPTAKKAYERPSTEHPTAWVITTLASILNVLAVGDWSFAAAGYPIYVLVTNAAIVGLIVRPSGAR